MISTASDMLKLQIFLRYSTMGASLAPFFYSKFTKIIPNLHPIITLSLEH